jgi:hypothetical protein
VEVRGEPNDSEVRECSAGLGLLRRGSVGLFVQRELEDCLTCSEFRGPGVCMGALIYGDQL